MLPPLSSEPPPRSSMGRFLFGLLVSGRFVLGLLVYLIGSTVLQFALLFVNQHFKLHLENAQTLFPNSTPLVGHLSWFSLIYLLFLIVLIWLLYRTGLMPRFAPTPTPNNTLDISDDEETRPVDEA